MRTKEEIVRIMKSSYEDDSYILVGEQLIGSSDFPENMFARYSEASGGELPAILGIDMGIYGMDLQRAGIGSEKWNRFLEQITAYAEKGGIVTASHHWDNPSVEDLEACDYCRGKFGDGTAKYWDELLTEGSVINEKFKTDLYTAGMFLKELEKRGVTILWRPLHEANGCWFWFTAKSCGSEHWIDAEYLKRLWRYLYNYYENELGLTNLIWVYGPNNGGDGRYVQDVMYYYPGDDVVDLVGLDWYTDGNKEIFDCNRSYEKLMQTGKVCAITEFGPGSSTKAGSVKEQEKLFNSVDVLNLMKELTEKNGMKCAYVLTWHVGYGAFSSMGKAKEALSDPFFCTLDRLNKLR